MPRQTKAPTSAGEATAVNEKAKKAKGSNGVRLDYLDWAWKFLRRNPEYRLLYDLRLDSPISNEERLDTLFSNPIARALPIELFDVEPAPLYGENLGDWKDRADSQGLYIDLDIRDIFDPSRYCLSSWLNPTESLPEDKTSAFDLSVFELAETWAINFKSSEQMEEFRQEGPSPRNFECGLGLTATKPTQVALRFDLRLPIDVQLEQAKRQLQNAVEVYKDHTHKNWHQIPDWNFRVDRSNTWEDMLALLDLLPEASSNVDLFRRFIKKPDLVAYDKDAKTLETMLKKAKWLRDVGYRAILLKGIGDTPLQYWAMKKKAWKKSESNRTPQSGRENIFAVSLNVLRKC